MACCTCLYPSSLAHTAWCLEATVPSFLLPRRYQANRPPALSLLQALYSSGHCPFFLCPRGLILITVFSDKCLSSFTVPLTGCPTLGKALSASPWPWAPPPLEGPLFLLGRTCSGNFPLWVLSDSKCLIHFYSLMCCFWRKYISLSAFLAMLQIYYTILKYTWFVLNIYIYIYQNTSKHQPLN